MPLKDKKLDEKVKKMEDRSIPEAVEDALQVKQDAISEVKNQFYKSVLRRLGDSLLEGISEYLGTEDVGDTQIRILKLPQFLKAFLNFFEDEQLLVEASLLYVSDSLGLMTDEIQAIYDQNLAKIESKRRDLQDMKDLLWVGAQLGGSFLCQFPLPPYLELIFTYLEGDIQSLITFGMLKILEWLGTLNSYGQVLIPKYERSFNVILQSNLSSR